MGYAGCAETHPDVPKFGILCLIFFKFVLLSRVQLLN
jgi:hypothetical protein